MTTGGAKSYIAKVNREGRPPQREAGAGNFFAPFFDVTFYRASDEAGKQQKQPVRPSFQEQAEKRIPPSKFTISSANGQTTTFLKDSKLANIRNFRSSLVIESQASTAVKATLTLEPPYFDALDILDERAIQFGSLMLLQWGYTNKEGDEPLLSNQGVFNITEPSVRFGKQITIQITGWDIVYSALSTLDRRCAWPREIYETDFEIVEKLIERHHGKTTDLVLVGIDAGTSPLFKKKTGQPVVQSTNDWLFLKRLLYSNDVEFGTRGKSLILKQRTSLLAVAPSYRLLLYGQPESDKDIPTISFDANSIKSLFGAAGQRGFTTLTHDLDKNKTKTQKTKPEDSGQQVGPPRLNSQETALPKGTERTAAGNVKVFSEPDACTSGWIIVKPKERPNQAQEALQKARGNRMLANTHATAIIPGHPSIEPLTIVEVAGGKGTGVGTRFRGNYLILKTIHEIGQGYVTKLNLVRGTNTGDLRDSSPKTKGPGNTQTKKKRSTEDPKLAEKSKKIPSRTGGR